MLAYAIAAAIVLNLDHAGLVQSRPTPQEFIGAWDVRVYTDPLTDAVTISAYLGTPADNLVIACSADAPDSTTLFRRSTTPFHQSRLGMRRYGGIQYRFDRDETELTHTSVIDRYSSQVSATVVETFVRRAALGERLVLRDALNEGHTAIFELKPQDTLSMLRRLDEVCGTSFGVSQSAKE